MTYSTLGTPTQDTAHGGGYIREHCEHNTVYDIILAGIIFGGLLEKRKKIAIGGYKFGGYWFTGYDRHAFSGSLRGWRNIGGFNIGGVTGNPPIRQI